jgi:hypothetical protein
MEEKIWIRTTTQHQGLRIKAAAFKRLIEKGKASVI